MKRFLTLVAVAVVAGAMYVAAAPGGHQATTPTAKQFAALKKKVTVLSKSLTALKKDEKQVKTEAVAAVAYIGACFLDSDANIQNLPVTQYGSNSNGFLYGVPAGSTPRTALDIDPGTTPLAHLQEVAPDCVASNTAASSSAHSSAGRLERWAGHAR